MISTNKVFGFAGAAIALVAAMAISALGVQPRAAAETQLLNVDAAFDLAEVRYGDSRLAVVWKIAPGYYLYRERIHAAAVGQEAASLPAWLPKGELLRDERGGVEEVYRNTASMVVPNGKALENAHRIRIAYQGCAEAGFCYPPQSRFFDIAHPSAGGVPSAGPVRMIPVADTEP